VLQTRRSEVTSARATLLPVWATAAPGHPQDLGIEWDANNRLTAVKQGASTLASFTYDGIGRRATKAAGGITTTFVYDGRQFLEERPSTGTTKRYVYGPGVDRPLAQIAGATTTYDVADHLGSVMRVTDSTGTPALTRDYDPWGNLLQGSTTGGHAFTGREWDSETGLAYYRARFYAPQLGRFLSEDPARLVDGANSYRYVHNIPVSGRDPSGLIATKGCDRSQAQELSSAAQKAEAAVDCGCCLPKGEDKDKWKQKIRTATYHCVSFFEQGSIGADAGRCAEAGKPPGRLFTGMDATFFEIAFTDQDPEFGCGCLQGTVLHEVAHLMGKDDPTAGGLCKKCFSCAANNPSF
jgi:RHS repeat-associated protein